MTGFLTSFGIVFRQIFKLICVRIRLFLSLGFDEGSQLASPLSTQHYKTPIKTLSISCSFTALTNSLTYVSTLLILSQLLHLCPFSSFRGFVLQVLLSKSFTSEVFSIFGSPWIFQLRKYRLFIIFPFLEVSS